MGIEDLMSLSIAGEGRREERELTSMLNQVLDDFFWDLNTDEGYDEDQYGGAIEVGFHPSGISSDRCMRAAVYDLLGIPHENSGSEIAPKLRRIFDNGHDLHDRWQKYFTKLSQKPVDVDFIGDWKCKGCGHTLSPDKEIPYPKDVKCPKCGSTRWKYNEFRLRNKKLRVTGKRDGKLVIKSTGREILLEIKSINTFQFKSLFAPLDKHIIQLTLYMYLSKTREGVFIYEDKNTQEFKILHLPYEQKLIKAELEWLREVNAIIDKGELPPRLDNFPTLKECKLCVHKNTCKSEQTLEELCELMTVDYKKLVNKE